MRLTGARRAAVFDTDALRFAPRTPAVDLRFAAVRVFALAGDFFAPTRPREVFRARLPARRADFAVAFALVPAAGASVPRS